MGISPSLVGYSLAAAQRCIQHYVDTAIAQGIKTENIVRAYTVSAEDALAALGLQAGSELSLAYTRFRAYVGLDPSSPTDNYKLFMVPVDDNGNDYIPQGPAPEYDHEGAFVYDFNLPCPNSCDTSSPLYYSGRN